MRHVFLMRNGMTNNNCRASNLRLSKDITVSISLIISVAVSFFWALFACRNTPKVDRCVAVWSGDLITMTISRSLGNRRQKNTIFQDVFDPMISFPLLCRQFVGKFQLVPLFVTDGYIVSYRFYSGRQDIPQSYFCMESTGFGKIS